MRAARFGRNFTPIMPRRFIALALCALLAPQPAAAQQLAPYERDLLRLAEILGALHYLRPLCGQDDAATWRDKMSALISADNGPVDRRERLAGAFNGGHRGFEMNYRTCTPSADVAIKRYLSEGARLSREIAARHGG